MTHGRSLELFYVDGTPQGLVTAEVFGWTGHVLRVPRTLLREGLTRVEAARTGVYLLVGRRGGEPLAYTGEAESVARRIKDHDTDKDWWTEVVIITTASDAFHKAHVRYLEARLIGMAREAGSSLANGTAPEPASLNEAAQASMEDFLGTLRMVLPALRIDLFLSGRRPAEAVPAPRGPEFRLSTPKNGIKGRARLSGGDFLVLAGARARREWAGKGAHDFGYAALHQKLVSEGVLAQNGTHAVLMSDYAFNSPSAAAAVLNGRPANGRLEWKLPDGRSYGDWEQAGLEAAS